MSANESQTVVTGSASSGSKKSLKVVLAIIVLVLVFSLGGYAGFSYGKSYEQKRLKNQIASTNSTEKNGVPSELGDTLFGQSIKLTNDADANKKAINDIFGKVSSDDLQKASFDELIQGYSYAQLVQNTDMSNKIKTTLQQRKSQFTKDQQGNLQKLGL